VGVVVVSVAVTETLSETPTDEVMDELSVMVADMVTPTEV